MTKKDDPCPSYKTEWNLQLVYILDVVTDLGEVFPQRGYENKAAYIADKLLNVSEGDLRDSGVPEKLIWKRNWLFAIVNAGDLLNVGVDLLTDLFKLLHEFETQPDRIVTES